MMTTRAYFLAVIVLVAATNVTAAERLPDIGPAPTFELTAHSGHRLSLTDLKGKVVALTFIYTTCPDVCPLLLHQLMGIQKKLKDTATTDVFFVSVTMDPEKDTPEHLHDYATWLGVDPERWAFLTGSEEEVQEVAKDYGVYYKKQENGVIDHNLLTSIVDQTGMLRVQYMGTKFNPDEFLDDLQNVAEENP